MTSNVYTLTQEQIQSICNEAVKKGVKTFREAQLKEEAKRKKETDKVEITKQKLKEYRAVKMKIHDNAISDDEIPELRFNALSDLMGQVKSTDERTERRIQARLDKQLADTLEIKNMDRAYQEYHEGCERWGSDEDKRRCRVIYKLYLSDDLTSVEDIAEEENIADRTVYRDVNLGVVQLASYLYGF